MDREKREALKDECIHKGYSQDSSAMLELIADLEAAEEKEQALIVGLREVMKYTKTDDSNLHRIYKLLKDMEGTRQ